MNGEDRRSEIIMWKMKTVTARTLIQERRKSSWLRWRIEI